MSDNKVKEVKYTIYNFSKQIIKKTVKLDKKSLLKEWPEWNQVRIYKHRGVDIIKIDRDDTLDYELIEANEVLIKYFGLD